MDILKTLLGILVLSCVFTVLAGAVIMGIGMVVSSFSKDKDQEKEKPDEGVPVQRS